MVLEENSQHLASEQLMPREKLLLKGATALTDQELLAIFLRTGIKNLPVMQLAENAIAHFGSLFALLSSSKQAFCAVKGLGVTQYIQLQACLEMTKRYLNCSLAQRPIFTSTEETKLYLQTQLAKREREVFMVLFLDSQHILLHQEELFLGTINSAEVHPREVIKVALKYNAAAIILAHNHPSGSTKPSPADIAVTKRIAQLCQLMEIRLLDHLIIGQGTPFCFAENNLLFE